MGIAKLASVEVTSLWPLFYRSWGYDDAVSIYRAKSVKQGGKRRDVTPLSALTDLHTQEGTGRSPVVLNQKTPELQRPWGLFPVLGVW